MWESFTSLPSAQALMCMLPNGSNLVCHGWSTVGANVLDQQQLVDLAIWLSTCDAVRKASGVQILTSGRRSV